LIERAAALASQPGGRSIDRSIERPGWMLIEGVRAVEGLHAVRVGRFTSWHASWPLLALAAAIAEGFIG